MAGEDRDQAASSFRPDQWAALRAARTVELRLARRRAKEAAGPSSLETFGRYLRRSRLLAEMTQQRLADTALVSQSMVSRVERAVAAAVPLGSVLQLLRPLDRLFPLGCCPHDHDCPWQPIRLRQRLVTDETRFIERMLVATGEPDPPESTDPVTLYDWPVTMRE